MQCVRLVVRADEWLARRLVEKWRFWPETIQEKEWVFKRYVENSKLMQSAVSTNSTLRYKFGSIVY